MEWGSAEHPLQGVDLRMKRIHLIDLSECLVQNTYPINSSSYHSSIAITKCGCVHIRDFFAQKLRNGTEDWKQET